MSTILGATIDLKLLSGISRLNLVLITILFNFKFDLPTFVRILFQNYLRECDFTTEE